MSPHYLLCLTLLIPASLGAAENLGTEGLDNTYVPIPGSVISCAAGDDEDREKKTCTTQPTPATRALTDKALRDAEHQVTDQVITNPQINNPDLLPSQIPPQPPFVPPTPQQLLDIWNSRPSP